MLVKARVTEAVVGAIVTHVTNNVIFQLEFGGPYTLIAHVSRTISLPANEFGRQTLPLQDFVHMREVMRKLICNVVALDARVVQAEQAPTEAFPCDPAPFYLPSQ